MINSNLKDNKGITLVTLMFAIVIMFIISSILIYNIQTGAQTKSLNNMYNDINILKGKIETYYSKHQEIPILKEPYVNVSNINAINGNDNENYYVIDLEALENIKLNYGKDYANYKQEPKSELTDIYVINEQSHNIYYVKGVQIDGITYYTIPGEYTKVDVPNVLKKVQAGKKYYASMKHAIDSIPDGEETKVILLEDIQEEITIPEGKIIKLELTNKTINGTIVNNGSLTIAGEGYINSDVITITNNNELTIESGNITTSSFADNANAIYQVSGSLKVLSGNISNISEDRNTDVGRGIAINVVGGNVELLGGTVSSKVGNTIRVQGQNSKLTIDGAEITSRSVNSDMLAAIVLIDHDDQTVTMNSGKIINDTEDGYAVAVVKGTFYKTGGIIIGKISGEIIDLNPVIADKSGANEPNIDKIAQKTYVTWKLNEAGTKYVIDDKKETKPTDWYDYENGKWANIKTAQNGLEAYWVWIPRYEYIVPTSEEATQIEVKFIPVDKKEPDEGYTIHPAFTNEGNGGFGDLDGIWVAKFEASSNTPTASHGGGDSPTLKVQVKPGVLSWRYIKANNMFTVCRKMTNTGEVLEGSIVDSHMMKNTEWGAVAILSQSKYGIYNPESSIEEPTDGTKRRIWNNPHGYNYNYAYTGYVGNNPDALNTGNTSLTNVSAYDTINGPKASTTGTIYGVYDMAGGSWEYVAGCIAGQENAKFGVTQEESKYVDSYTNSSNSTSNYDGAKTGDATKEVKGWNKDNANFINLTNPVFSRGRRVFICSY